MSFMFGQTIVNHPQRSTIKIHQRGQDFHPPTGSWNLGGEVWQLCDRGRNIGALIRGRSSHTLQHLVMANAAGSYSHWIDFKGNGLETSAFRGCPLRNVPSSLLI